MNFAGVFQGSERVFLPQQRLGHQRAARAPDRVRTFAEKGRPTACPACASTATTCSRWSRCVQRAVERGARGRGRPDRGHHLPHGRPLDERRSRIAIAPGRARAVGRRDPIERVRAYLEKHKLVGARRRRADADIDQRFRAAVRSQKARRRRRSNAVRRRLRTPPWHLPSSATRSAGPRPSAHALTPRRERARCRR
jgi:hypothetical protein